MSKANSGKGTVATDTADSGADKASKGISGRKPTADKAKAKVADKAKADSNKAQAATLAVKAGRLSANRINTISYKGTVYTNPTSKTPMLQQLRATAASAGACKAQGDIDGMVRLKAFSIFAIGGGFTYVNDQSKPLASIKSELRGYVQHEFVQLKHNPTDNHKLATADWCRMLWHGLGNATLANGATILTVDAVKQAMQRYEIDAKAPSKR